MESLLNQTLLRHTVIRPMERQPVVEEASGTGLEYPVVGQVFNCPISPPPSGSLVGERAAQTPLQPPRPGVSALGRPALSRKRATALRGGPSSQPLSRGYALYLASSRRALELAWRCTCPPSHGHNVSKVHFIRTSDERRINFILLYLMAIRAAPKMCCQSERTGVGCPFERSALAGFMSARRG